MNKYDNKPVLLDLFCGAGGGAMGYSRAGWMVVGVDKKWQRRFPFQFIQADVMKLKSFKGFDGIHASPPCQGYSDLAYRNGNHKSHPKLIHPTRVMLEDSGLPFVIENVEGAPLRDPVLLCGTMFKGLRVIRHRLFETNFPLPTRECRAHPLVYTLDKRKPHYGTLDEHTAFVMVNGGGNCSVEAARDAMGIDWMTKAELNEAIPPAYTQWIGRRLLQAV